MSNDNVRAIRQCSEEGCTKPPRLDGPGLCADCLREFNLKMIARLRIDVKADR